MTLPLPLPTRTTKDPALIRAAVLDAIAEAYPKRPNIARLTKDLGYASRESVNRHLREIYANWERYSVEVLRRHPDLGV